MTDNVDAVKLLLKAGADIDLRNDKREQAINLAELNKNKAIAELLHKHKEENKLFGIF